MPKKLNSPDRNITNMFGSLLKEFKNKLKKKKSATTVFIDTPHVFIVFFELGWELDLQS